MGSNASVPAKGPDHSNDEYVDYSDDKPRWVMHKNDKMTVRYAKKGIAARQSDGGAPEGTLMDALKAAAEKWGPEPAMRVERPLPPLNGKKAPASAPVEEWKTWSYKEYHDDVRRAAKGFLKLGAVRYDGVNILGFNSPEWFMAELAGMYMGGMAAGIYPTDTPDQVLYKTKLSDGAVAVVDTKSSFDKYAEVIDDLPYLKAIVAWSHPDVADLKRADGSVVKCLTWDALLELGETEGSDADLDALCNATEAGNCCTLVFTSGTTGNPKAVMVSHDNLMFQAYCVLYKGVEKVGAEPGQDRVISYLPLSHVAGMMVDIISPLICTAYRKGFTTVHFARPYDLKVGTFGDRLRAVKPTMFLGVPRVWEKIAEKIKAMGASTQGLKKTIATWAKDHSLYFQKNLLVGGSGQKGWGYSLANKLILGKIKAALGLDECKFMFSGAAPMSMETLEYFASLGININEVYGMSESTGATTWSTDACHLWTSIGYEMHGCETKVFREGSGKSVEVPLAKDFYNPTEEEQGEVCFRGRHIMMGYLCNPKLGDAHVAEIKKKNEEAIDEDGFMHSGDKGSKDVNLMYRITGRYKELIITAGGENISPVPIENALKLNCPAIANAVMVGDKRKFNCCLITLKCVGATGELPGTDKLDGAAVAHGCATIGEAAASAAYTKMIEDAIKATNNDGTVCPSNASKIQKFTILPQDLSVETGEITPSLKLKRSVTEKKYINIIEAIYKSKDAFTPYSSAPITQI